MSSSVRKIALIFDATVTYDLKPTVQLYLNATNIFNSRYEPVNGFQMPGAAVVAGARLHW